jgi:hypothetical protein
VNARNLAKAMYDHAASKCVAEPEPPYDSRDATCKLWYEWCAEYALETIPTIERALPVPMILHCPECCARHIDEGEFATKVHHTHACQSCGFVWRPAVVPTVGVQFLPGFKNEPLEPHDLDKAGVP